MQKKSILVGTMISALLLTACAKQTEQETAQAEAVAKKSVAVGSDLTFPPYE